MLKEGEKSYEIALLIASQYSDYGTTFSWNTKETEKACVEAVEWGISTKRNSLGVVLAVIRALRDNNFLKENL
jgi:hypothetical protein